MNTKLCILALFGFLTIGNQLYAQRSKTGNPLEKNGLNYIGLGLEVGPTLNQYSRSTPIHFGLPVKVYLGRQKKGRFIMRTGLHFFPSPKRNLVPEVRSAHYLIIPLAIGYRRNIQDWYIEGSIGAASTQFRRFYTDDAFSPTKINYREINYGLEVGKQLDNLDVGIAAYNTGPFPLNILCLGIKASYRLKW
ncbi:hypothetical protein KUV23_00465 [Algoriphagus marincola]|uniref:Outer membrane protein beta-barrel domain-containing protein n=1 Tax=Algoriphagus marincola TaxID=264027 RepID=A0ABS7N092_9BACT|nr:hypothetical protein [Algoriphagus marincola]MBY5949420.1 hypothetical protein [Algoriphagus marincola]